MTENTLQIENIDLYLPVIKQDKDCNESELDARNKSIAFDALFNNLPFQVIANTYKVSKGRVSQIVSEFMEDSRYAELLKRWNKKVSGKTRAKVLEMLDYLDVKQMNHNSLPTNIGVMIDKARLIDGETIQSSTPGVQVQVVNYGTVNMGKAQDAG